MPAVALAAHLDLMKALIVSQAASISDAEMSWWTQRQSRLSERCSALWSVEVVLRCATLG